jgi:radical SAM superfamily enzyme YgiQ (UPF0313 family)
LRCISFIDDTFGIHPQQFDAFVRLYRKAGLHRQIPWVCATRADVVTRDWARKARSAGCLMVTLGLESSNERTRMETLNKRITDTAFREAMDALRENGIFCCLFIILGLPGESALDVLRGIRKARSMRPLFLQATPYAPVPGTALRAKHGEDIIVQTRLMNGQPRISTDRLSVRGLWLIFQAFKIKSLLLKLRFGFSHLGPSFGWDLLWYLYELLHHKQIGVHHPAPPKSALNRKIMIHLISRWKTLMEQVDAATTPGPIASHRPN